MTHSKRKTPITGFTVSDSDKPYKVSWHKKLRVRLRSLLRLGKYEEAEVDPPYEPWNTPKDGKMVFNPDDYPELMRK